MAGYNYLREKYNKELLDINTPIIGIFGAGEKTNKNIIIKSIGKEFILRGYKLSLILNNGIDVMCNSYAFPHGIFSNERSDENQIILFNNFIYDICKEDKSDLIIIEVPYGIVPISKEITNNFGVLAFKIGNALKIDIGIMSVYLDAYSKDFFEEIELLFKYRVSISNVYFNLHNKSIDWMNLREEKKLKLMNVSSDDLNIVKQYSEKDNVFILSNKQDMKGLANVLEEQLKEHACVDTL